MKTSYKQNLLAAALLGVLALATARAADVTPAETRAIAKEAYIYGYPMVDSYRIEYGYFVDRKSPEFKAPVEPDHKHSSRLYAGGQGDPNA